MDRSKALSILKRVFGVYESVGKETLFKCPACDHHKNKLSINLEKNAFKCWVCDYKGKNIRRAIRKYGSYKDLREWEAISGRPDINDFDLLFSEQPDKQEDLELPKDFLSLTGKNINKFGLEAYSYLLSRGLTREDIINWKIGFCHSGEYRNRVIVPSFDEEGKLNYFVGRSYREKTYKYKNPKVSNGIVFNELFIDWNKDLTIVEGVFDAIVADNAVPILGSTITKNSKLLKNIVLHDTPIYIALDSDAKEKENTIIKTLLSYDIELFKIDTNGIEDIGSITKSQFLERKAKAKKIESMDYLLLERLGSIR